jgi:hypothetical protein
MASSRDRVLVAIGAVIVLTALACGSLRPPEDCGVGGTADESAFSQHFSQMELVSAAAGEPGAEDPEMGTMFAPADTLEIRAQTVNSVEMRACVQERVGGGGIVFDQTLALPQGSTSLPLGSFSEGSYVIRVAVGGVLVRNLSFGVR